MFTVKQAANLTGVPEATLRVWERRYAVVVPARSASGYRQYSEADVQRLREMAALVHSGVPASAAASSLRETPQGEGDNDGDDAEAAADLVAAAVTLSSSVADRTIARELRRRGFEDFVDGWLQAQLVELGAAWADGRVSVAQEHFVSAALVRALHAQFLAADPASGPAVLVGLPPGERHDLVLLAFATCLRRAGVDVVYLGADVPIEQWPAAAALRSARAAVVGVSSPEAAAGAERIAHALAEIAPPTSVWVGGSHNGWVGAARHLPHEVSVAASLLARRLRAGAD